jgi:hypothetical protein
MRRPRLPASPRHRTIIQETVPQEMRQQLGCCTERWTLHSVYSMRSQCV